MDYDVKNIDLAPGGRRRIEWAENEMPVLRGIRQQFKQDRPLAGLRVSACLHVTTETANLMHTLQAGGADVVLTASNPLSTQDDVAAALVTHHEIPVYAIKGEDERDLLPAHPRRARPQAPHHHGRRRRSGQHAAQGPTASCWRGSSAAPRRPPPASSACAPWPEWRILNYPIIAVNDAMTKHLFDNRYGTGQSTIDGIIRATNADRRQDGGRRRLRLVRPRHGHARLRSGGNVVVTEIDPLKAWKPSWTATASCPWQEAAAIGDIFVTAPATSTSSTASTLKR
jgi:adenosylhomocysteinase